MKILVRASRSDSRRNYRAVSRKAPSLQRARRPSSLLGSLSSGNFMRVSGKNSFVHVLVNVLSGPSETAAGLW